MSETPQDIMAAAMRALMVPEHEMVESVARAILAERNRHNTDKPATTVYGNLLWRHMDACRKHGVPSPEQDRLFKLSMEFRAVYPDECKVWEDRYPGTEQPERATE